MSSKAQRIGIWIIAVAMILGTVVGFLAMILSGQNNAKDQGALQKYQAAAAEAQKKQEVQTKELSDKYYATFSQYKNAPTAFDAAAVTELSTQDLSVGDGEEVTASTKLALYYIGWNPSGKVFDQSIDGTSLKAPFDPTQSITGFKNGIIGMKIGSVRELTIPSKDAYGETGSGADIPPNTPIKFIVMAVPKPADIPQPEITQEVLDAIKSQRQ